MLLRNVECSHSLGAVTSSREGGGGVWSRSDDAGHWSSALPPGPARLGAPPSRTRTQTNTRLSSPPFPGRPGRGRERRRAAALRNAVPVDGGGRTNTRLTPLPPAIFLWRYAAPPFLSSFVLCDLALLRSSFRWPPPTQNQALSMYKPALVRCTSLRRLRCKRNAKMLLDASRSLFELN